MRGAAGVGHQQELDLRLMLQQFAGEMRQPADAGRGVADGAGAFLGRSDQLRQRRDAEIRRNGEEHRVLGDEADRQEVARHLQRHVGRCRMQRHEGRQHRLVQRIAVGSGVCGGPRGDAAAGARLVHHQDLLAPELAKPFGDKPQRHIRRGARRRIRNDLDRLVRIGAGLGINSGSSRHGQQPGQQQAAPKGFHHALHLITHGRRNENSIRAARETNGSRAAGHGSLGRALIRNSSQR